MSSTQRKTGTKPRTKPSGKNGVPPAPLNGDIEILVNGVRIQVPAQLNAAVRRAIEAAAQPLPKEMTTTQAADFLDVSRPFVIKLIKRGELPRRMVGKHRRIPSDALMKYREKMFERAKAAADEMTRISQEMGLY